MKKLILFINILYFYTRTEKMRDFCLTVAIFWILYTIVWNNSYQMFVATSERFDPLLTSRMKMSTSSRWMFCEGSAEACSSFKNSNSEMSLACKGQKCLWKFSPELPSTLNDLIADAYFLIGEVNDSGVKDVLGIQVIMKSP